MYAHITQQHRENIAQHLQQWGIARHIPQRQLEQMIQAILAGHHDEQISQGSTVAQLPVTNQHQPFLNPAPAHGFQTPFGFFQIPAMPPLPMPLPPPVLSPPILSAPSMFPVGTDHAPTVQHTRTIFPGGDLVQQNLSNAGQEGSATFQYSSSSSSMNFTSGAQLPLQPPALGTIQYVQQPAPSMLQANHTGLLHTPEHLLPQVQQHPLGCVQVLEANSARPSPLSNSSSRDPAFNPVVAPQEPQNPRLAGVFQDQLNEETYFSDPPGMPDIGVRR